MAELRAAKVSRRKNRTASALPNGSLPNATGRVLKISAGPASGCNWNANTSGKIMKPASMATPVSQAHTVTAQRGRLASRRR